MMSATGFILYFVIPSGVEESLDASLHEISRDVSTPLDMTINCVSRGRFARQSHRFANGNANGKSRAAAFAIPRNDLAAVRLYELPGDGKPKTDTAGTCSRTAIKLFEDLVLFTGGKTTPAIGHRNGKHGPVARSDHFDRFVASPMRGRV